MRKEKKEWVLQFRKKELIEILKIIESLESREPSIKGSNISCGYRNYYYLKIINKRKNQMMLKIWKNVRKSI